MKIIVDISETIHIMPRCKGKLASQAKDSMTGELPVTQSFGKT